jgi:hypothetical protein
MSVRKNLNRRTGKKRRRKGKKRKEKKNKKKAYTATNVTSVGNPLMLIPKHHPYANFRPVFLRLILLLFKEKWRNLFSDFVLNGLVQRFRTRFEPMQIPAA